MGAVATFLVLVISSSLVTIYATPKQLSALKKSGIELPISRDAAILQGIALSGLTAALGAALQGITTFTLLAGANFILPTVVGAGIGIGGHLLLYYAVFRPCILKDSAYLGERIRLGMGLPARMLQGGIIEEVQFRWGLMSLTAATATFLLPFAQTILIPVSIAVSGLLFAYYHYIGARQIGLVQERSEIVLVMVDNTWGGLIFGWLFWRHGLITAMISHALFHLVWYPIERHVYRRDQPDGRNFQD